MSVKSYILNNGSVWVEDGRYLVKVDNAKGFKAYANGGLLERSVFISNDDAWIMTCSHEKGRYLEKLENVETIML